MSRRATSPDADALGTVIGPAVVAAGYDLETLTLARAGARTVVRVVVDGDGGVGLDAIAAISTRISAALDDADEVDGSAAYTLEVTSPGVDRPLTTARHWRRAVGHLVRVTLGDAPLVGRILAADPDPAADEDALVVLLDVDGVRRSVPLAELGPGKVQVEFARKSASEEPS